MINTLLGMLLTVNVGWLVGTGFWYIRDTGHARTCSPLLCTADPPLGTANVGTRHYM